MKHRLVGVHQDGYFNINDTLIWRTTYICSCGFTSNSQEEVDKHTIRQDINRITEDFFVALSEVFSKDDS